jgi:hypothetical protein
VARTYAEVFELARQTGSPVYSDDRFFRSMLSDAGIATFGTVALLLALRQDSVITEEQFTDAVGRLRERGALGLPSSGSS